MKALSITALALFAGTLAAQAQSKHLCGEALDASLRSGAVLIIDSLPAGIEITATDQEKLHATCSSDADVYLKLSGSPTHTKLVIEGTRTNHDHLDIHLEVPRKTNLEIEMAAGQVTVKEITGDKRINLHAGQITITSPHMSDYKKIDATVGVGQVNAPAYGTEKGGFFRTFKKENPEGDYLLQAHVGAGQIDLQGKSDHPGTGTN